MRGQWDCTSVYCTSQPPTTHGCAFDHCAGPEGVGERLESSQGPEPHVEPHPSRVPMNHGDDVLLNFTKAMPCGPAQTLVVLSELVRSAEILVQSFQLC